MQSSPDPHRQKQELREQSLAERLKLAHREHLSREICRKFLGLPEYLAARTVMSYVDFRTEVQTRDIFADAWRGGKRVVVPYCAGSKLHLFRLASFDELAPGTWEILEPLHDLRTHVDRHIDVSQIDLIVMPGVAFDRRGGRVGHGKGYYDHLLQRVAAHTVLVALAFECQVFPEVPMLPHDVYVHKVITEKAIYGQDARLRQSPR